MALPHGEELQFDLVGAGVSGEPVSFQIWIVAQRIALAHVEVTQRDRPRSGNPGCALTHDYFVVTAAIFIAVVGDVAQSGDKALEYLGARRRVVGRCPQVGIDVQYRFHALLPYLNIPTTAAPAIFRASRG